MDDLYYMQFSNLVLETMKTAKQALTDEEYEKFTESVKLLCEQEIRIEDCVNKKKGEITMQKVFDLQKVPGLDKSSVIACPPRLCFEEQDESDSQKEKSIQRNDLNWHDLTENKDDIPKSGLWFVCKNKSSDDLKLVCGFENVTPSKYDAWREANVIY